MNCTEGAPSEENLTKHNPENPQNIDFTGKTK